MRRRRGLAAMMVAVGLVGACSRSPGVGATGSVSPCFRAIPVAKTAVHDPSARLVGVHRVAFDTVRGALPASAATELQAENDTSVCAIAWKGSFAPGQVDMAPSGQAGSYALVLVSSLRLHLVGAVVLDHLPRAFGGQRVL